ncbi:hypothetical protein, partial [Enterobacter hormaechei]|uniref:hypothetical protein n=1 Tax=Enterobacter hormaechei TaxID=158836 RepID=UPI0026EC81C5
ADRNRSHWSTSKTPSYTKSVSWQHHPLNDRINSSEKKYCWNNNVPIESSKFIEFLEKINIDSNIRTRVIVVQPHTRKSIYNNGSSSNIRKQLDVLLISAETAIKSSGAEFYIIGCDDSNPRK